MGVYLYALGTGAWYPQRLFSTYVYPQPLFPTPVYPQQLFPTYVYPQPLFPTYGTQMVTVLRRCRALVDNTTALLLHYSPELQQRVQTLITEVSMARVEARECYIKCRNHLHVLMMDARGVEDRLKIMNTDDAIRMQTFLWALITGINQVCGLDVHALVGTCVCVCHTHLDTTQVQICCNVVSHHCKDTQPLVIPFL